MSFNVFFVMEEFLTVLIAVLRVHIRLSLNTSSSRRRRRVLGRVPSCISLVSCLSTTYVLKLYFLANVPRVFQKMSIDRMAGVIDVGNVDSIRQIIFSWNVFRLGTARLDSKQFPHECDVGYCQT